MSTVAQRTGGVHYYRELCQKGSSENFLFDKYVFRHISIFPTIIAIKLGVRPNTATLFSLLAAVGSCFFLVSNESVQMLVGALLIFTYYTLDHVDGELARYYIRTGRQEPSLSGQYFDVLVHSFSANLMLFFLGVSIYHQFGYWWAVYAGFIGCIGASSLPALVAARVLMQQVVVSPDLVERPEAQRALDRIERRQRQIAAMQGKRFNLARLEKIIAELVDFPGLLILIMLVVSADAFLGEFVVGGVAVNGRLVLVTTMAFVHTLKTIVLIRRWLTLLRPIR